LEGKLHCLPSRFNPPVQVLQNVITMPGLKGNCGNTKIKIGNRLAQVADGGLCHLGGTDFGPGVNLDSFGAEGSRGLQCLPERLS
jgi:hypothetical protein